MSRILLDPVDQAWTFGLRIHLQCDIETIRLGVETAGVDAELIFCVFRWGRHDTVAFCRRGRKLGCCILDASKLDERCINSFGHPELRYMSELGLNRLSTKYGSVEELIDGDGREER